MFMGKAQLVELGLKNILTSKYGYDDERIERWSLGRVVKGDSDPRTIFNASPARQVSPFTPFHFHLAPRVAHQRACGGFAVARTRD